MKIKENTAHINKIKRIKKSYNNKIIIEFNKNNKKAIKNIIRNIIRNKKNKKRLFKK